MALDIRELLQPLDLELFAKTSGSKDLQLYLPWTRRPLTRNSSGFALAGAQLLERRHPTSVVSAVTKALRKGKVLIDRSQNSRRKTTIAAYSLRARPHPTVSTPVSWHEVDEATRGEPSVVHRRRGGGTGGRTTWAVRGHRHNGTGAAGAVRWGLKGPNGDGRGSRGRW